jgi:hypothetical protein
MVPQKAASECHTPQIGFGVNRVQEQPSLAFPGYAIRDRNHSSPVGTRNSWVNQARGLIAGNDLSFVVFDSSPVLPDLA